MNELNLVLVLLLKPAVIIVGAIVLLPLWKMRQKPGLLTLFWSTVIFMIGELICGVDVYGCNRMTLFNEGAHDTAMMLAFAGYIYGIFTAFYHKRGCLKLGCDKYRECALEAKDCELSHKPGAVTLVLLFTGIVLSMLPMLSTPVIHQTLIEAGLGDKIFGSYLYDRTSELYLLQQIAFPGVSIAAFLATMAIVVVRKRITPTARKTVSLGLGALSFVYFRVVLVNLFHPQVIFTTLGEEIIELLFMLLLACWILPVYRSWKGRALAGRQASQP
jgi:hypothetical protein